MVCQLQVDNRAKELACKLERAIKVGDAAFFARSGRQESKAYTIMTRYKQA